MEISPLKSFFGHPPSLNVSMYFYLRNLLLENKGFHPNVSFTRVYYWTWFNISKIFHFPLVWTLSPYQLINFGEDIVVFPSLNSFITFFVSPVKNPNLKSLFLKCPALPVELKKICFLAYVTPRGFPQKISAHSVQPFGRL